MMATGQLPAAIRAALQSCAAGRTPPNVALMLIHLHAATPEAVDDAILHALSDPELAGETGERLRRLQALHREHPDAWRIVRRVIRHEQATYAADGTMRIADAFDLAVRASPEASVALYALGDPGLLAAASAEIVAWLKERGAIGRGDVVLDLGCGIGRLTGLLAAARLVVGSDISAGMLAVARKRCGDAENVSFVRTSGRDLAAFADATFHAIVAADTFPYLVQLGLDAAARHIEEAARVLRPRGMLALLNFSYRHEPARDLRDVANLANCAGFDVVEAGERPFSLWDGMAFLLRKR